MKISRKRTQISGIKINVLLAKFASSDIKESTPYGDSSENFYLWNLTLDKIFPLLKN